MTAGINLKGIVAPNGTVHQFDHESLANNPPIPQIDSNGIGTQGTAPDSKAALDEIKKVAGAVAAPYDPTSGTYAVGAYCSNGNKVYKCITAIDTPEAWTAAHWSEVPVATDLAAEISAVKEDLKNASEDLSDEISEINDWTIFVNHLHNIIDFGNLTPGYVNGQGNINSQSSTTIEVTSSVIEIDNSHTYKFTNKIPSTTGQAWLAVGIWDSDNSWIGRANATVDAVDLDSIATLILNVNTYPNFNRAKYIRVSWRTYGLESKSITKAFDTTYEGKTIVNAVADIFGPPLSYGYRGFKIDNSYTGLSVEKLPFNPPAESSGTKTLNGMAIYNGVIFQAYSDGSVTLIDAKTGAQIITHALNAGHGASLSFANEFPTGNNEFPYLYVESYIEPKIFVYSVTRETFALEKIYYFPNTTSGYYQEGAVNKYDNTVWVVGHKVNSFTLGEKFVWTHWDLSTSTDNGDGTFTPTLIDTFETPFILYMQGIQILNNQIFIFSGADSAIYPTVIYVMKIGSKEYTTIMDDFPSAVKSAEIEGLDFVLDEENRKYYMIFAMRKGLGYYKVKM